MFQPLKKKKICSLIFMIMQIRKTKKVYYWLYISWYLHLQRICGIQRTLPVQRELPRQQQHRAIVPAGDPRTASWHSVGKQENRPWLVLGGWYDWPCPVASVCLALTTASVLVPQLEHQVISTSFLQPVNGIW